MVNSRLKKGFLLAATIGGIYFAVESAQAKPSQSPYISTNSKQCNEAPGKPCTNTELKNSKEIGKTATTEQTTSRQKYRSINGERLNTQNTTPMVNNQMSKTSLGADYRVGSGVDYRVGSGADYRVGSGVDYRVGSGADYRGGSGVDYRVGSGGHFQGP